MVLSNKPGWNRVSRGGPINHILAHELSYLLTLYPYMCLGWRVGVGLLGVPTFFGGGGDFCPKWGQNVFLVVVGGCGKGAWRKLGGGTAPYPQSHVCPPEKLHIQVHPQPKFFSGPDQIHLWFVKHLSESAMLAKSTSAKLVHTLPSIHWGVLYLSWSTRYIMSSDDYTSIDDYWVNDDFYDLQALVTNFLKKLGRNTWLHINIMLKWLSGCEFAVLTDADEYLPCATWQWWDLNQIHCQGVFDLYFTEIGQVNSSTGASFSLRQQIPDSRRTQFMNCRWRVNYVVSVWLSSSAHKQPLGILTNL